MSPVEWLLLGYAIGVVPASMMARVAVAAIAKRMGVEPSEIDNYADAADGGDDAA